MRAATEKQVSFARGMASANAPSEYQPDEVAYLLNGRVSFDGQQIVPRGGSVRTHSTELGGGAQGYGAIEFRLADGTVQLCTFVGDRFYISSDNGATWSEEATGLREDYWSMVQMRVGAENWLICANGSADTYYWTGAAWGTLTDIPSGVLYLAVFNGRLYAAGYDGANVAFSKVRDPNTWAPPDGSTVQCETHDGDMEIQGMIQMGSYLLVFKRDSTGYIEGFGYESLRVAAGAVGLSRSVGCIAPRSICPVGDQGLVWLSERGFEFWSPGGAINLISRPVQQFLDQISWTAIKNNPGTPVATYWPTKNEYLCAFPGATATNDYVFRWRAPTPTSPPCIAFDKHGVVGGGSTITVDADGYMALVDGTAGDVVRVVSGYVQRAPATGPGIFVGVDDDGYVIIPSPSHDHAVLFAADRDTEEGLSTPWSVGYDGFVRKLESGSSDDVVPGFDEGKDIWVQLRGRPFTFGDQMRRKRGRVLRVATAQGEDVELYVRLLAEGAILHERLVTAGPTPYTRPEPIKVRTNGKGYALQVDVATKRVASIGAIEMVAQLLNETW